MIKDPESFYLPGTRGMFWFKLKKELATLDVVVVAAELGHGKRNNVLSDYTFAVRDEGTGDLQFNPGQRASRQRAGSAFPENQGNPARQER
jgi:ATP-dependent DNA ligase